MKYERAPARLADIYRAADVFVHAAIADNFPNVVLEAQACGVPVIASACGGIPEQILGGETGLLLRDSSTPELVAALQALLADVPRRERMGRSAADWAAGRFDLDLEVQRYLAEYGRLSSKGGAPDRGRGASRS
jgi:glycosyltransferase involved in cell wall biosynthesis